MKEKIVKLSNDSQIQLVNNSTASPKKSKSSVPILQIQNSSDPQSPITFKDSQEFVDYLTELYTKINTNFGSVLSKEKLIYLNHSTFIIQSIINTLSTIPKNAPAGAGVKAHVMAIQANNILKQLKLYDTAFLEQLVQAIRGRQYDELITLLNIQAPVNNLMLQELSAVAPFVIWISPKGEITESENPNDFYAGRHPRMAVNIIQKNKSLATLARANSALSGSDNADPNLAEHFLLKAGYIRAGFNAQHGGGYIEYAPSKTTDEAKQTVVSYFTKHLANMSSDTTISVSFVEIYKNQDTVSRTRMTPYKLKHLRALLGETAGEESETTLMLRHFRERKKTNLKKILKEFVMATIDKNSNK